VPNGSSSLNACRLKLKRTSLLGRPSICSNTLCDTLLKLVHTARYGLCFSKLPINPYSGSEQSAIKVTFLLSEPFRASRLAKPPRLLRHSLGSERPAPAKRSPTSSTSPVTLPLVSSWRRSACEDRPVGTTLSGGHPRNMLAIWILWILLAASEWKHRHNTAPDSCHVQCATVPLRLLI
jgi:hypothetical protein